MLLFVSRLRDWDKKVGSSLETDEKRSFFINFAKFFAEIFAKIESVSFFVLFRSQLGVIKSTMH